MKGYHIDSAAKVIRESDYEYTGRYGIASQIGTTDSICIAWVWHDTGDVCFVDDSGLLKPQVHFFGIRSRPDGQPLPGNGFVTGPDNATDSDPPHMTLDQVRAEIVWLDRQQFEAWAKGRGTAVTMTSSEGTTVLETWDGLVEHSKGDDA